MAQICTTREQSKRLLELGIKSETADMTYTFDRLTLIPYTKWEKGAMDESEVIPAWSLSALIEIMPSIIESWGDDCCLQIGAGHIQYAVPDVDGNTFAVHGDLMDCAVDTIEWLKNNEYI